MPDQDHRPQHHEERRHHGHEGVRDHRGHRHDNEEDDGPGEIVEPDFSAQGSGNHVPPSPPKPPVDPK